MRLPSAGKSTEVADPDSEAMGAFILDCDMIKMELPEYKESHGTGADVMIIGRTGNPES